MGVAECQAFFLCRFPLHSSFLLTRTNIMKKILIITVLTLLGLTLLFQQTARKNQSIEKRTDLPWMVSVNPDGGSTIFGQTLGKSTLSDFQDHVKRQPEIRLFRDQDTSLSVEALFEKIDLGGIISNVILELDVPENELSELEKSALKRTVTPSGAYELHLSSVTEETLTSKTISSISYSPVSIRLDAEMIKLRFGKPAEIIKIDEKISHFLYPLIGLDVILDLNRRGSEVFQYVRPADFDQLRQNLYGNGQNF